MNTNPENTNAIRALSEPEQSTDTNHLKPAASEVQSCKASVKKVANGNKIQPPRIRQRNQQEREYRIPLVVRVPRTEFLHFLSNSLTNAEKHVEVWFGQRAHWDRDFYQLLYRMGFEHDPQYIYTPNTDHLYRPDCVVWYQVWYHITDYYQVDVTIQARTKREALKIARQQPFHKLSRTADVHWRFLRRKVRPCQVWLSHRENPDQEDNGWVDK